MAGVLELVPRAQAGVRNPSSGAMSTGVAATTSSAPLRSIVARSASTWTAL
jgi:hypothetical protein